MKETNKWTERLGSDVAHEIADALLKEALIGMEPKGHAGALASKAAMEAIGELGFEEELLRVMAKRKVDLGIAESALRKGTGALEAYNRLVGGERKLDGGEFSLIARFLENAQIGESSQGKENMESKAKQKTEPKTCEEYVVSELLEWKRKAIEAEAAVADISAKLERLKANVNRFFSKCVKVEMRDEDNICTPGTKYLDFENGTTDEYFARENDGGNSMEIIDWAISFALSNGAKEPQKKTQD